MVKSDESIVMKAIALCFKPRLKPEEALIYTNLGRTQFAKKCSELGINKNAAGYYEREDLDLITSGEVKMIDVNKARAQRRKLT